MSIHNKIEIVCIVVLVVGSESSQNWVRVVSGLGPIRLGSEKYQGSELSWVRVVRLPTISSPCEPDGSGELKMGIPLNTPVFIYKKWGLRGYLLHRHVFLMIFLASVARLEGGTEIRNCTLWLMPSSFENVYSF